MTSATRSCPHSQFGSPAGSRWAPKPFAARKFASRRVRSAVSAKVLRRSPHTVIGRSGTTSAISSRTAPLVHSLMGVRGLKRSSDRSDLNVQQIQCVVAHHLSDVGVTKAGQLLGERDRILQAFAVRPVRSEQNLVDTDDRRQLGQVVFVVGGDPDVVAQLLHRIYREQVGVVVARFFEPLAQPVYEVRTVLDADRFQLWVT